MKRYKSHVSSPLPPSDIEMESSASPSVEADEISHDGWDYVNQNASPPEEVLDEIVDSSDGAYLINPFY